MCDPYQPCEMDLGIVRRCLELIDQYGFGAAVLIKSDRVLRDLDLLTSINNKAKAVVQRSLTIADEELSHKPEPNICSSERRYEVLKEFQKAGRMRSFCPGFMSGMKNTISCILRRDALHTCVNVWMYACL